MLWLVLLHSFFLIRCSIAHGNMTVVKTSRFICVSREQPCPSKLFRILNLALNHDCQLQFAQKPNFSWDLEINLAFKPILQAIFTIMILPVRLPTDLSTMCRESRLCWVYNPPRAAPPRLWRLKGETPEAGRGRVRSAHQGQSEPCLASQFFTPVLRICNIWLRFRIRGSVPLTYGSGSCYFRHTKTFFSAYYFLKVYLHHF
jgi:hypothetical protein